MGELHLDEIRCMPASCIINEAKVETNSCCNPYLVDLQETILSSAEGVPHNIKEGSASALAAETAVSTSCIVPVFAWCRSASLTYLRTIDRCQNCQDNNSE